MKLTKSDLAKVTEVAREWFTLTWEQKEYRVQRAKELSKGRRFPRL